MAAPKINGRNNRIHGNVFRYVGSTNSKINAISRIFLFTRRYYEPEVAAAPV